MIKLFSIVIQEKINVIIVAIHLCFVSVCTWGRQVWSSSMRRMPCGLELMSSRQEWKFLFGMGYHWICSALYSSCRTHTNTHLHLTNKSIKCTIQAWWNQLTIFFGNVFVKIHRRLFNDVFWSWHELVCQIFFHVTLRDSKQYSVQHSCANLSILHTTHWPPPERSLPWWQSAAAAHLQSWCTAVQNCSLPGPVAEYREAVISHPAPHTKKNKIMCFVVFLVFKLRLNTNLEAIDVHYAHSAIHLCGTQPVIDLL